MARPVKQGLDYFSFDVDFYDNRKVRKIMRSCGPVSGTVLSCLMCNIYRYKGYYILFDDDLAFDISDVTGTPEEDVNDIINKAIEVNFFNQELYEKYGILTSDEIQKRFKQGSAKRTDVQFDQRFLISSVNNSVSSVNNSINDTGSTQSKVKESKVNTPISPDTGAEAPDIDFEIKNDENTETVTDESDTPEVVVKSINIPFEDFWDAYKKKVGNVVKLRKKWEKLSNRDRVLIMEHIPKYIASQPEKQYRKNPETYLNNQAWLDEIIAKEPNQNQTGSSFPDYWSSDYEKKLDVKQLQSYWAHLRSLGLYPVKDRFQNTIKWEKR
ncbi:DUF4373 domain-containing protein [Pedobacter sp. BS3]|uniref:DUF4373 domain-containing protein n=1 Tax=Pedobacter sp. BS3 TaxID=2567937 RepID=UPI0011ED4D9C|nr:DUF4373 domain-containing protein [Pedobacter sp. BS3]TZF84531.1 DUF4373 domain-containing protein [Pedobacter sp. BS3]